MMSTSSIIKTQPDSEPVTLAEAKEHCRVTGNDDDAYIGRLITQARQYVEFATGRTFITTTRLMYLDWGFPASDIMPLPHPPLLSVVSVQYVDGNGTTQTMSVSDYSVDTGSHVGRIILGYGKSWPTVRSQRNAVTVQYTCGYGPNAADVPAGIKQAIQMLVLHAYDQRSPTVAAIEGISPIIGQFAVGEP